MVWKKNQCNCTDKTSWQYIKGSQKSSVFKSAIPLIRTHPKEIIIEKKTAA